MNAVEMTDVRKTYESYAALDGVEITVLPSVEEALLNGNTHAVLSIPEGFAESLGSGTPRLEVVYPQGDITSESLAKSLVWGLTLQFVESLTSSSPRVDIAILPGQLGEEPVSYTDYLTPGLVGMMAFWTCLGAGPAVLAWRQQGILDRIGLTRLCPIVFLSTQMIARLTLSIAQTAAMLGVAALVYGFGSRIRWLPFAGVLLLVNAVFLSLGMCIASLVPRTESAWSLSVLITTPLVYLGGTYFDIGSLPPGLSYLAAINPITHANTLLRYSLVGASGSIKATTGILAAWLAGCLAISAWRFRWTLNE